MDQHYKQHLYNTSVALEQKEREVEYLKSRMSEMEVYYRGKVAEGKAALAKKDEELKSFKDRVAGDVAVSIKTGKPESMEYPASRTRLRELYDDLRLQWPTIKSRLKAQKETPESLKALIQKIFSAAFENMEQQKSQIDKLFGLIERSSGPVPQKVYEYKQLTIQCLQLTLYQKRLDEAGSKTPFIQYDHKSCTDVMDFLVSHCHWLACLMALNNPPLKPDWDHHDPGMDTWDILPRNIRASTAM